ncbi:MAG: hypothetical protein GY839_16810 [candidate division Zixibacteria bacterium]|nr:hypothetical protein [candidate division Zixibacteria bacterium]
MMSIRPIVILTILIVAFTFNSSTAGSYIERHRGLYLGLGGGFGSAQFKINELSKSDRISGMTYNFRTGVAANDKILFGLEIDVWHKNDEGIVTQYNNYGFCMIGYLDDRFYIKSGLSITKAYKEINNTFIEDPESKSGRGATIGVGIEERILRNIAVLPSFQYIYQSYSGYTVNYFSFLVNICWFQ